jgi:tetratricopeptide (TPR) repeat protein
MATISGMGGTSPEGFDPAALLVIVLVAGAGVALGIMAFRRRRKIPRWLKQKVKTRLDVIRRDLDRMAEYTGGLRESVIEVSQPFEYGRDAMAACRWSQAIERFREAQAKASPALLIPLLNQIGVCHYIQGELLDALWGFAETARLAEEQGDKPGRTAAINNVGVIRHDHGELGRALELFKEALAMARAAEDPAVTALCLNNIGNVQRERGELDGALQSHEEALAISRGIGDEQGVVSSLGNIGSVRRDKGELDKALERYAEAVEKARKIGYNFGYAIELGGIGGVYRDKGELDRALKFHEDSLAGARNIGFRIAVATELGNVGLILVKKDARELAVPKLIESLTIFLAIGVVPGQLPVLLGLSRCDDSLGRERMEQLFKQAGLKDDGVEEMFDRVDQIRRRRPRPKIL